MWLVDFVSSILPAVQIFRDSGGYMFLDQVAMKHYLESWAIDRLEQNDK